MSSCIEDELEAIESVLCEDYKRIRDIKNTNYIHSFEAFIFPCEDLNECHCSIQLLIEIPINYPNIIPSIQILSFNGISQTTSNNLIKHLNNTLTKQLNQEMLYNIIHITKEYLKQYNFIGADTDTTKDNNNEGTVDEFNFDEDNDEGFNDDDGGWDDINEYDDDVTLNKSLQSIQKIMDSEQKTDTKGVNTHKKTIKYKVLNLEDVIDDNIGSSRLLAVGNVYELAMCNNDFYAEYRQLEDINNKYEIRIGINMSKYIDSKTLLNVLGFYDNEYMVIRFEFNNNNEYINSGVAPKVIEIGKSIAHKKQVKGKCIKLKNKLQMFIGSRSIMNRINNKLFARLWPPIHLHKYYPIKYKQILQLMVITKYNYNECKMVLEYCKDYEKALVYLSNNNTNGNDNKINNKNKNNNIISEDMQILCNKLISYGMNEILQKKNDEEKEGHIKFQTKEFKNKQLNKFLMCASEYFMHNILIEILYFSLYSILTLSKRCLVCDILFPQYIGLIKPTICNNKLCMYGYQELEIGLDISTMIKNDPEIIDLLITFFYISVKKNKLYPNTPIDVHALPPNEHINFKKQWKKSDNLYIYQETKPKQYNVLDIEKLQNVLNKMPSIDTLLAYAKKGNNMVKKSLSYKSKLLWPLLRWIIVTNRSYLKPLRSKKEKFDGLPSCFQFKFISYTPEREYMFRELSVKNNNCGYRYGWHGSPISNWHNILRNGLKNMSGSNKMANGAAFGKGIYLAPNSGTSYWYCEPSQSDTWILSMFNKCDYYGRNLKNNNGHGLYCLALCQILNHPKLKSPQPYYVVPTESWVMIRYLFIFNTIDNKVKKHWTGKGRYFDINAEKCIQNYIKKITNN